MIMKHFTISPIATETARAGYSPKTLVVVITIVAAGAAVLLGFTNYYSLNLNKGNNKLSATMLSFIML